MPEKQTINKEKPLKVLHVCGSHNRTGTQKVFLRLVLAQSRLSGYVVIPVVAEGSWLEARLKEREVPHETAPFKTGLKTFFDKKTRQILEEVIKRHSPDVIQNWAGKWSKHLPKTRQPQIARLGLPMPIRYARGADYVVCATEDVCAYAGRKLPAEKVRHIPTLVNIPPKGFEDFRYDVRAEFGIPHDAHLVLLLGRLHESKGFDVALFALNTLPRSVHVLIVGEGAEHGALEDAVTADGLERRVHFAGWIDNTSPMFAAADSFLLPSRRQSSCNVILEAWAHKLPVVATDIPAARALVTHEKNGILIPPEDEIAIAKAVERILEDRPLRESIAREGAREVASAFAEKEIVSAYDALYKEAVISSMRREKPPKNKQKNKQKNTKAA